MKSMEASAAFANVEPGPSTVPGLNPPTNGTTPDTNGTASLTNGSAAAAADPENWSAAQQKQLEDALKETDAKDAQRWEKIADKVEGKNKKQCMQRYKKLVQMIKEAKQQQQQ